MTLNICFAYHLSFTFGFTDVDNKDGEYQDLNTVNFNVPSMLGGGYHFMQFDGKYQGATAINNFNYHAIRAVDRSNPSNLVFQDTSFKVELGSVLVQEGNEIKVKMNVWKNANKSYSIAIPKGELKEIILDINTPKKPTLYLSKIIGILVGIKSKIIL